MAELLNPLDLMPSSKRKTSKLTRKHNRLPGDAFAGYFKVSLIAKDPNDPLTSDYEFTGDWNLHLDRIMGVTEKRAKPRRYRMKFYLIDVLGNKYEPIDREINRAITIKEMCQEIDKMVDELSKEQDYLIDFYKSYVVVRA